MPEVRLIDANALAESDMAKLIDKYLYNQCNLTVGFAAALMPTIEPEVRHGRWIPTEYDSYADGAPVWDKWECSECSHEHSGEENTLTAFCPDCGARMNDDEIAESKPNPCGTTSAERPSDLERGEE
jgi:rubrerythrin